MNVNTKKIIYSPFLFFLKFSATRHTPSRHGGGARPPPGVCPHAVPRPLSIAFRARDSTTKTRKTTLLNAPRAPVNKLHPNDSNAGRLDGLPNAPRMGTACKAYRPQRNRTPHNGHNISGVYSYTPNAIKPPMQHITAAIIGHRKSPAIIAGLACYLFNFSNSANTTNGKSKIQITTIHYPSFNLLYKSIVRPGQHHIYSPKNHGAFP